MIDIIGREAEMARLQQCFDSGKSEFVIVYGRRRIGKTFLVRRQFNNRFTFSFVGGHQETLQEQLNRFASALQEQFRLEALPRIGSWSEAFGLLRKVLVSISSVKRKLIFFDEMPWMDTPKSRFITALESFWNGWAATRTDIMLIACGSSTAWMVRKILENQGGLYGRVTEQIYLRPFNLCECEQMIQRKHGQWDRYQITQAYMTMGGVPYYFDMLDVNRSLSENIDRLFFADNGRLAIEFNQLYATLFHRPYNHVAVVKALAKHPSGLTREQLTQATHISGGGLSSVLNDLKRCDMIDAFNQYKTKTKAIFRLVDLYTLFYYRFVADNNTKDKQFWSHNLNSPGVYNWQGGAFEIVALIHIEQIKRKLGIAGVATSCYAWRNEQTQIDLVVERADRMINLCEMKFSEHEFEINKHYAERMRTRAGAFKKATKTRYGLLNTFVTTYGVAQNMYSYMAQNQVTADDLFEGV